jgi:hypothetical protein
MSMDVARRNYADCRMMRDLAARYDAGQFVPAMAMLELRSGARGARSGLSEPIGPKSPARQRSPAAA